MAKMLRLFAAWTSLDSILRKRQVIALPRNTINRKPADYYDNLIV